MMCHLQSNQCTLICAKSNVDVIIQMDDNRWPRINSNHFFSYSCITRFWPPSYVVDTKSSTNIDYTFHSHSTQRRISNIVTCPLRRTSTHLVGGETKNLVSEVTLAPHIAQWVP